MSRDYRFEKVRINPKAPLSVFAAGSFCRELNERIDGTAALSYEGGADFVFEENNALGRDDFAVSERDRAIVLSASGVRGFIYCAGKILRNIVKDGNGFILLNSAFGEFSPCKSIRGHQLGYRTTPNTYDAWSYEDYERYYLELMYFGVNTAEHIPYQGGKSKRNPLMKYDEEEFLIETSAFMNKIDLDVSLWHPNYDGETDESAARVRGALYSKIPRIDHVFIPGGDPGSLPADVFVSRCRAISGALKKSHPHAKMWASAQAPHEIPGWGETFIEAMSALPEEIDGVIYGPNHALPLEELRERLPSKYPLRFYPDITHNVRCEYPVHFEKNDWHYALAACLGRECANPRVREYAHLYEITKNYVCGSVSYSEGITDDVNKALWSCLDYDEKMSPEEAVSDYCRLFFFGSDTDKLARLIFALEENWQGAPDENSGIDETYDGFLAAASQTPALTENWRFVLLLMRAQCDKLVRDRLIFEKSLLSRARACFESGNRDEGIRNLETPFPEEYMKLREDIEKSAAFLFDKIGLQSDVERYFADNPERGAVLDTIDLSITGRAFILSKIKENSEHDILPLFMRGEDAAHHFSVALDGVKDEQQGEVYHNFMGDRPSVNDGTLPAALFDVFDNFTFVHTVKGLNDGKAYTMRAVYLDRRSENARLEIKANGTVIYSGAQFGREDKAFDLEYGHRNFVSALYDIPAGTVKDGVLKLEFAERDMGVMISELFIYEK
ncbi:MAG: hypothetical protein IJM02_03300 [Clostridia bacterium]|nr:hypothetical protein [Clostridia bacterium]